MDLSPYYEEIFQLLQDGLSARQVGETLSEKLGVPVTKDMVNGIRTRHLRDRLSYYEYGDEWGDIPTFNPDKEVLKGDFLILNDIHIPYTDYDLLLASIDDAKDRGIDQVIIAGDFFNMASASRWEDLAPAVSLAKELKTARKVLKLLSGMKTIHMIRGNHDDWFRNVDKSYTFRNLISMITDQSNVFASDYDRVNVISGQERWVICHQKESGRNWAAFGERLAYKFQKHVWLTHIHKNGIIRDNYDRYTIVTTGGVHEPNNQAYINLKTTTNPAQMKGYGFLINGTPSVVAKGF